MDQTHSNEDVHRRRWLILAVLCTSVLVIVMDGTIINVALPSLVKDLGASTSQLQWIEDAYTLVFAGLLLASGSLSDRFGRKGFLIAGMTVFGTCSAIGAMSGSASQLITARAAMGIGAAMIFPATLAILINVFRDAKERAKAIAIWAATSGISIALGPVTGGYLLEHFWWGSVQMVNVPIVAVALVAIVAVVPNSKDHTVQRADPFGMVLSIAAVSILVWATIEGPSHGWLSATTLGAFAAAMVLGVAFVQHERNSTHPMLDLRVFANRRFSAGVSSINVAFFGLMGFTFMVTQYFQFVRGYSALSAGLHTVPFAVFTGVAAPMSTKVVARFGTKLVVATGLAMTSVGFVISSTAGQHGPYAQMVLAMFFMGTGLGLVNAPATDAVMGSLDPEKAGVGSAVNDTSRELGGTLGVAILGSVFSSIYTSSVATGLRPLGVPAKDVAVAQQSVGAGIEVAQRAGAAQGSGAAAAIQNVVDRSFMDGFVVVGWVAASVVLLGALVALRYLPARVAVAPTSDGVSAGSPSSPESAASHDLVGVSD
jgi:EmrB/QacA subfamily drug resistance transporter